MRGAPARATGRHGGGIRWTVRTFCRFDCVWPFLAIALGYPLMAAAQGAVEAPAETAPGSVKAPEVRIRAPRFVTPLPGVTLERSQMTTNVQSATSAEMEASRAINLTDYMNQSLQSVSVNDYRGNPYQQDLNFRGFSASPLIGTPQGLSVYLDGVRVNEPFGDVVNWDLLPMNAIRRMDVIPGSNPLFGLNTLGGALALTTKSGFTDPVLEATLLGGSWGRRQAVVSIGGNNGTLAGFVAIHAMDEDGWRDNSPSSVRQAFAKGSLRFSRGEVGVSFLGADNSLTGNGMIPRALYEERRDAVFTSPDTSNNRLAQLALHGQFELSDSWSLGALGYRRDMRQNSTSGDFYDEWDQAANGRTGPCPPAIVATQSTFPNGAAEIDATGCPNITPNGLFNIGETSQLAHGLMLQGTWVGDAHQLTLGASRDENTLTFVQRQRLGFIGDGREVFYAPERELDTGLAALSRDIVRNNLTGSSETNSLFALGVWAVKPQLSLTGGLRYNRSRVRNNLISDRPIPLYQFTDRLLSRLRNECGARNDPSARFTCTEGDYEYHSFNPYVGASWLPKESFNVYANWSRGARAPTPIELGCARDRELEAQNRGFLLGCSIPTALSGDPFLPQVRSTSIEGGFRGELADGRLLWNAGVFRTDLQDDILFVSLGRRNRGVFDTFGQTRRQGVELGLTGAFGVHTIRASYSRVDATFESTALVVNPSNSTSLKQPGEVAEFAIQPGDRIPGIPRDTLRLSWYVDPAPRWTLGLTLIAHSWSYARGNENNDHQAGGTDSDGRPVTARNDPTITVNPGRAYVDSGRIPGYAILNFNATFRMTTAWSVFARIDNVFDRRFETAGELGINPFAPSRWGVRDSAGFNYNSLDWQHSLFVGPGAPRAAWIGVTYSASMPGGRGG